MDIWQQILDLDQTDQDEIIDTDCREQQEEEEEEEENDNENEEEDPEFGNNASFGLLKHRYTNTNNNTAEATPSCIDASKTTEPAKPAALSTDDIIKLAGARVIDSLTSSTQNVDVLSILDNPFKMQSSSDIEGITEEDVKNVELIEYLLSSADNFGRGNYNRALSLLDLCDSSASQSGTPVQRAAYYFSKALRQRILNTTPFQAMPSGCSRDAKNAVEHLHCRVPFSMASQLVAVQAILENVVGEKRIHVVDLKIRAGLSIIALMQALSGRAKTPLELLKVTAVASNDTEERSYIGTGRRLSNFARGMHIPFLFKVAKEDKSSGLHKGQVELEPREVTVVYSEYGVGSLISKPSRLDAMMKFVRSLHPRVMVVLETEANHNSSDFGHRFVEALFTAAARFDCMAECMGGGDEGAVEEIYLNERIRNVVMAEGDERVIRDVKIGVWRKYFERCRMIEIQLSKLALDHAKLVVSMFPCAESCLVQVDRKSLLLGWKDTPLVSVSAWKFVGPKRKPRVILDDTMSSMLS
ncbi:DELLA protein GAI [Linum perenne]